MPMFFSEKILSGKLRWQWKFPQFPNREGIFCASRYESILGCVCVVSSRLKMEVGWEDHLVGYRHVRLD